MRSEGSVTRFPGHGGLPAGWPLVVLERCPRSAHARFPSTPSSTSSATSRYRLFAGHHLLHHRGRLQQDLASFSGSRIRDARQPARPPRSRAAMKRHGLFGTPARRTRCSRSGAWWGRLVRRPGVRPERPGPAVEWEPFGRGDASGAISGHPCALSCPGGAAGRPISFHHGAGMHTMHGASGAIRWRSLRRHRPAACC